VSVAARCQRAAPRGPDAAEKLREQISQASGVPLDMYSDSEMLDSIEYHLFPNMCLFPGVSLPMIYRFRPIGTDPSRSLFDLMFLKLVPPGTPVEHPPEPVRLTVEQSYAEAPGMNPGLGGVYDQDTDNLALQYQGFLGSAKRGQTLGNYPGGANPPVSPDHRSISGAGLMTMDPLDRLTSWQAIYDLSCDYMRAQDRLDPALHISVFHDDATTDYGAGWQGDAPGFVAFAQRAPKPHKANHHMIGQVRIDFESGDLAFGEVYFQAHHRVVETTAASGTCSSPARVR
jgi:hypothetical protein